MELENRLFLEPQNIAQTYVFLKLKRGCALSTEVSFRNLKRTQIRAQHRKNDKEIQSGKEYMHQVPKESNEYKIEQSAGTQTNFQNY